MSDEAVGVYLVDDEADVTRGLGFLLASVGIDARAFNSAPEFLAELPKLSGAACVVLDLRLPEIGGLEVMERLEAQRPDIAILFLSAHGDVPTAVRAMRHGAIDFLQKPFNPQAFLDCVQRAAQLARKRHREWNSRREVDEVLRRLSPREAEVFRLLCDGASSKEIGRRLAISYKTVEVHRANVLYKLKLPSTRALVLRFRDRIAADG